MADDFDPYYQWLAIPPKHQPPNLYRLLGVDEFESNLDVIENAADQRMAHVRMFQSGPHGEISQRLLNEITAAKLSLLNVAKKAEYDQKLRAEKDAAEPRRLKPLPRLAPTVGPTEVYGIASDVPSAVPSADGEARGRRRLSPHQTAMIALPGFEQPILAERVQSGATTEDSDIEGEPMAAELSMVDRIGANAELVINVARSQLGGEVGYDEVGVRWLDGYIQRQHEQGDPGNRDGLVDSLGSYLGECIIRTFGGEWVQANGSWCVRFDGSNAAYPFAKVGKHLEHGAGDSVLSFFTVIPVLFQGKGKIT